MIGKKILLFLSLASIAALAACGGPNNLTLQNPPAPAMKSASVVFSPTPVTSLSLGAKTTLIADVSNDPTNAGVDWALLCQAAGNCGTLTPLHTASGSATTYMAPPSITGNSQAVTIQAFASANHNSNTTTLITVTGFAGNLKGKYVFETNGQDANGMYQLAGIIVLDGNGNVTSGEQTHNDPLISISDPITGGSYYIGPDGRGTLTLNTADQNIGQLGIENLAIEVISKSQALIGTLDDNSNPNLPPSYEMSLGTLDLQTSAAAPTGGYAFVVNGLDISDLTMGMGGVFDIDSPNTISGAGSVADQDDSYTGVVTEGSTLSGTLTTPDSFGSLKFNLTTGFAPAMQFTGYIVDATHIKLIESDNAGTGSGFGTTAGFAVGQGAATGTFITNTSFAGTYVFDIEGEDPLGIPLTLASYGQFTADSNGNLNAGYNDEIGSAAPVVISDSFTGTYTLDASGTGRIDSTINYSINGPGPELIFYLTGNGNPPLVLDADDNSNSLGFGSIGVGFARPQSAPPFSFSGRYGVEFAQGDGYTLNTATGQTLANSSAGTLSGVVDTNDGFVPQPDTTITGTFGSVPTTGRFTGTLNNSLFPSPTNVQNTISVAFYPVDDDLVFFIETDYAVSSESTFGYFTTRTPVCSVCP
ncbi:MAG: hypothetical protein WA824_15560 [Candidatus Sulfotelmatobacter sp.]